ncbi:hypothetical protein APY04_2821 [Hyphomicrobium sulfonivorans]|uniref:Uncharacterized protein n=1 Tax=Hyphomicrobium sulfonivorans TaxID=121290 RepID=A0A109BB44_HYPSL|nr:hypothetical protein APY04_2821 [Hyphomicrobium sulfonivorans]
MNDNPVRSCCGVEFLGSAKGGWINHPAALSLFRSRRRFV